jgi:hypothetical protein
MKNTKKFFVVVTSVLLVFAMIGCDQGTKVEYRDRVVGGNGGPTSGTTLTPEQQFVLDVRKSTFDKPVLVPNGLTLIAPLTIENGQHIWVGKNVPTSSINSVGDGLLFAASVSGNTFNIAAQLTVASGGKLTVEKNSAVNVTTSADASTGLTVKGGAIVDVRGANGLHIEAQAKARFESGAILAVPAIAGAIVVEKESSSGATGSIAIESGLKLVIPGATGSTKVFTPSEGATSPDSIFTIPENSGALAINSEGLEVYTDSNATADTLGTVDTTVTTAVETEAETITPAFARPSSDTLTYIIVSLDGSLAVLKAVTIENETETIGAAKSYVVPADVKAILEAVYAPNKPGTTDTFVSIETGKSFLPYTNDISAAVLGLFHITFGTTSNASTADLIEIKGSLDKTSVLDKTGTGFDRPILIIDIGQPGDTGNSALPTFRIPTAALGTGSESYGGVRLRVNKGAYLHIEANNSNYITNGAGYPSPSGNFKNGCVEVLAGGQLRDGAFEGFPLGDNATILNRLGSYLAVGPEPDHTDATKGSSDDPKGAKAAYDAYYAGWLIGKSDTTAEEAYKVPRIEWDDDNTEDGNLPGYIEVRNGELVLSAKVTVKKLTGLIYDVWFVNTTGVIPAEVTIDAEDGGLFANNTDTKTYRIYGQSNSKITVKNGSISKSFLDDEELTAADLIPGPDDEDDPVVITNGGPTDADGNAVAPVTATKFAPTFGYLNWSGWAVDEDEAETPEPAAGGDE